MQQRDHLAEDYAAAEALFDGPTPYARACHDCALGLLNTAREVKRDGNTGEVIRLVNNARWYWRRFTNERKAS